FTAICEGVLDWRASKAIYAFGLSWDHCGFFFGGAEGTTTREFKCAASRRPGARAAGLATMSEVLAPTLRREMKRSASACSLPVGPKNAGGTSLLLLLPPCFPKRGAENGPYFLVCKLLCL